ncbi:MAG TPA: hypothetical protein QF646_05615 [Candidatus Poseidoniales archaeon]|nr:hypothetical protein [Candidatus Poseidoniales archaeon]
MAESSTSFSLAGRTLVLSEDELDVSDHPMKFKLSEIERFRSRVVRAFPPLYGLDVRIVPEEGIARWMRVADSPYQKEVLDVMEEISAACLVALEEHTGRSVEADEHAMSVVEQVKIFPERWPRTVRPEKTGAILIESASGLHITLPSKMNVAAKGGLLLTLAATIALSSIFGVIRGSTDDNLLNLFPLLIVTLSWVLAAVAIWCIAVTAIAFATGIFNHRHSIVIGSLFVQVRPRFLNVLPSRPRQYPLSSFRDLDVTPKGGLTLLLGNQRISCELFAADSRWVVSEIARIISGQTLEEE